MDGSFVFESLPPGSYELTARSPKGVAGPLRVMLTQSSEPAILRLRNGASLVVQVRSPDDAPVENAQVRWGKVEALTDARGVASLSHLHSGTEELWATATGFAPARARLWVPVDPVQLRRTLRLKRGAAAEGLVVDEKARPIEGATVRFQNVAAQSASAQSARTDAKGRFFFEALAAASGRFTAQHPGFAPAESEILELDGYTPLEGVRIRMQDGLQLMGLVVFEGGAAAHGAQVELTDRHGRALRSAVTDAQGKFEVLGLRPDRVQLYAQHPQGSSAPRTLDLRAGDQPPQLRLILARTAAIEGRVVTPKDTPVEGAQLWAWGGSDGGWTRRTLSAVSDPDGRFRLSGLEAGLTYQIRAAPPQVAGARQYRSKREPTLAQPGEQVRIVLEPDGAIEGRVQLQEGGVPALYWVSLDAFSPELSFSAKDGAFSLRSVPAGEYAVRVRGAGFAEARAPAKVRSGETTNLGTISLKRGRSLSGRVEKPSGEPIAGAAVMAGRNLVGTGAKTRAKARFGIGVVSQTTSDAQGEFQLSGVRSGYVVLVAEHESLGRSTPLELVPTQDAPPRVTLVIPEPASLDGLVLSGGQPAPNIKIHAQSQTSPGALYEVRSGADGRFRFDRLAPDTYRISGRMTAKAMVPSPEYSRMVILNSAQKGEVTLDLGDGALSLTVAVESERETFTKVYLLGAPGLSPQRRRALDRLLISGAHLFSLTGVATPGHPVRLDGIPSGDYSLCGVPYPSEIKADMGKIADYLDRQGDRLPAFCRNLTLTAAPPEQRATLRVQLPEYVPQEASE